MNKQQIVQQLLAQQPRTPAQPFGEAFAPSNIALCKYWGKRDTALNLPMNSSLSISLGSHGAKARIALTDDAHDCLIVNGERLKTDSIHAARTSAFLDLFRDKNNAHYQLQLDVNIPLAAGLASSACIYASLVKSLTALYGWSLDHKTLSILARLGSGSACRSLSDGFVEWHHGILIDGMDSFAEPLDTVWPTLRIGLAIVTTAPKAVSSREGMQHTLETSSTYASWPEKAAQALQALKTAIAEKDFDRLGEAAEANARAMHETMLNAEPPLAYSTDETRRITERVWQLRAEGLPVYFTQDAGPNIKLLFLSHNQADIINAFPHLTVIEPFE